MILSPPNDNLVEYMQSEVKCKLSDRNTTTMLPASEYSVKYKPSSFI